MGFAVSAAKRLLLFAEVLLDSSIESHSTQVSMFGCGSRFWLDQGSCHRRFVAKGKAHVQVFCLLCSLLLLMIKADGQQDKQPR